MLLLGAIAVTAQLPQVPRTRTEPAYARVESKSGDISGSVVTESGQPLAGAEVYVRSQGAQPTITKTNRDGVFKVSGLNQGSYIVSASMPSYHPKSPASHPAVFNTSEAVTLVMIKGGVITGTVTNLKGDPVVAIGIKVEKIIDERGLKSAAIIYEGVTDDRGVYRIYGLPTGTYVVSADGGLDFSPTGVNAFSVNMPTYAPSSSRDDADEISVRVGEESTVDIRYRAEHGNAISGFVKAARTGDRGFRVTLTSLAEKGPRIEIPFQDANGEFAFEGIPDGDYHLSGYAYWNDQDRATTDSMVLAIRGSDIEGLQLTVAAPGSITGSVVLKELKAPVADCTNRPGPPLNETTVTAWHRVTRGTENKPQFLWRSRGSETPTSQGNITLRELSPNEYFFGVRLLVHEWYLQSIAFVPTTPGAKPANASSTWTTIKPGDQLSGLTITLAQGAAQVRGEITLAEGQTLPDKLSVYLVPAEAAHAEDALRYFAAPVSTSGNFGLYHVAPGRYWMLAQPGSEDTRMETSKIRLPDAALNRSALRHAAEQKKVEIELKPCQVVGFKLPL